MDEYAADKPRDIHIYYKLLEKPLPHKKYLVVDKDEETAWLRGLMEEFD